MTTRLESTADLVREARRAAMLSQRDLAAAVGTSGPTIAAYERGTKEPRLSTLRRIAEGADLHVDVQLVARSEPAQRRARRQRRSIAVAAVVAAAVESNFDRAVRVARRNQTRQRRIVGGNQARRWIDQWERAIDQGSDAVRAALLDDSPHGHDMRQMSPFAGLITDRERRAALAAADALERFTTPS